MHGCIRKACLLIEIMTLIAFAQVWQVFFTFVLVFFLYKAYVDHARVDAFLDSRMFKQQSGTTPPVVDTDETKIDDNGAYRRL